MKIFFVICISIALTVTLQAQKECPCCTEVHRQFDFWLGDWVVKDSLGNTLGENQITKIEDGCILSEQWKGAKGSTGRSYNYYDTSDSSWNQLWIDNSGGILNLKGGFDSGSMILKSELQKGSKVDWYYNQISWTANKNGSVSQLWEIYDKEHRLLQTAFLGIYHRKEPEEVLHQEEEVKNTLNKMWAAIENEDLELYASFIHPEMEEPRVVLKGDVAWISYYWKDRGTTNDEAFTSRGKSTRIFVRENEKWLCIHGHYTLLPEK